MSEHGFHVHGPHDHALEHAAQGHGNRFTNKVAMFTAIKKTEASTEAQMHQRHRWAQATTVLQVAIALAAIALLTRKVWVEYAMFGTGALGIAVGILAALTI